MLSDPTLLVGRFATSVLGLALAVVCGCSSKRGAHDKFIAELEEGCLIRTDGLAIYGVAPPGARGWLEEAKKLGIDLLALYRESPGKPELRVSLAYLLLVEESEGYLEHVSGNTSYLSGSKELRVWTYVLDHKEAELNDGFRNALIEVLQSVETPLARLAVAKHHLGKAQQAVAVEMLLDVLADPVWDGEAWRSLCGIPQSERSKLLLPYLDTESGAGAYAPAALSSTHEYREKSLAYLERLMAARDPAIAEAAKRAYRRASQHE